jgi:membrane-bound metal-dependent hydrolase YbcI (DUF457 family)
VSLRRLLALQLGVLVVWRSADALQATLEPSVAYAVLDEIAHAAVALFVAGWLLPAWGVRPVIAALIGGTLIDIDHAIAAGSLDPERMMALGARPASHSLLAAATAGVALSVVAGWQIGYAAAIGMLTHVLRDAGGPPGAALLLPFDSDHHIVVAAWVLPAVVGTWSALNLALPGAGAPGAAAHWRARHSTNSR